MMFKYILFIHMVFLGIFSVYGDVAISGKGFFRLIDVAVDSVDLKKIIKNRKVYDRINVKGFSNINSVGFPSLPVTNVLMAIPENSKAIIDINASDLDTISCNDILPASELQVEGDPSPLEFNENQKCYSSNEFFPKNSIRVVEKFNYLGVEIAKIQICPIQFNPVSKKVIINKKIQASVDFVGGSINQKAPIYGNKAAIIKKLVINGDEYARYFNNSSERVLRDEKKVLIVTHNDFKPAADSLAVWQRMKGYDVAVVSDTSWVVKDKNRPKALVKEKTDIVKKIVKDFYDKNGRSGYLLIMGGWWFVPNELLYSGVWSDQCYTAMTSSLIFGQMPRGRIACETLEEAMLSVRKIIQYESNPCMDSDFYESFLMASMFEGSHENGYSEKRFAKTAEEIFQYLTNEQGYSKGERVYNYNLIPTESLHPTNWNDGTYANGGLLPKHLQWPTFAWDGTKEDVSAAINKGKFLALYRGHGQPTNWSAFKFHIDDIKKLKNRKKYPIVFSVTCNTGKFDRNIYNPAWDLVCFTQEFLQAENSGAAGVFGAAQSSFSGPNDALAHALIDAIWPSPGTSCVKPTYKIQQENRRKDPIYTLGDIALYGLGRMAADWNTGDLPMQKNLVMYHYFGDPTTKIVATVPKIITASSSENIPDNASSFSVSGINCSNGIATLVNMSTGKLLGKANVSGSSVSIPVSGDYSGNDIVSLTITSNGYKPFIKSLNGKVGDLLLVKNKAKPMILFNGDKLKLHLPASKKIKISIYDLQGRCLIEKLLDKNRYVHSFDLRNCRFSTGVYMVKAAFDENVMAKKISFVK